VCRTHLAPGRGLRFLHTPPAQRRPVRPAHSVPQARWGTASHMSAGLPEDRRITIPPQASPTASGTSPRCKRNNANPRPWQHTCYGVAEQRARVLQRPRPWQHSAPPMNPCAAERHFHPCAVCQGRVSTFRLHRVALQWPLDGLGRPHKSTGGCSRINTAALL
jgi:hypothetical protein